MKRKSINLNCNLVMGHVLIQESARKPMAIRIVLREIVIEGGTKRENRIEKKVAS